MKVTRESASAYHMGSMVTRLRTLVLRCNDIDRSQRFYSALTGFNQGFALFSRVFNEFSSAATILAVLQLQNPHHQPHLAV